MNNHENNKRQIDMEEREEKKSIADQLKEILKIVLYLLVLFTVTLLFIRFVMQRTDVIGRSMEPTLADGDSLLTDKLSYRFKDPERFDIVVFPFEPADGSEEVLFIKRIIGLPGETVEIGIDGTIYINGEVLQENYGKEVIESPGRAAAPVTLGPDEYFVMGDNRNNSMDSRDVTVGNISADRLVGKAWVRIFPFSKFGILKHQ